MTGPSTFYRLVAALGMSILTLSSGPRSHGRIHWCGSKGRDHPAHFFTCWGRIFLHRKVKSLCPCIDYRGHVMVSLNIGHYPQTNGQTERLNNLEKVLRCMTPQNPNAWIKIIMWEEHAHNNLPRACTGMSPFQCVFGCQPQLFSALDKEVSVPSVTAMVFHCHCGPVPDKCC